MRMTLKKKLALGDLIEESSKTKKAREKLKEKLDAADKKITPEALKRKSQEISKWIERHADGRVSVKKDISLFDQNQNSVKISRNTEKVIEELKRELQNSRAQKNR